MSIIAVLWDEASIVRQPARHIGAAVSFRAATGAGERRVAERDAPVIRWSRERL
jgi:hypothetical protein